MQLEVRPAKSLERCAILFLIQTFSPNRATILIQTFYKILVEKLKHRLFFLIFLKNGQKKKNALIRVGSSFSAYEWILIITLEITIDLIRLLLQY